MIMLIVCYFTSQSTAMVMLIVCYFTSQSTAMIMLIVCYFTSQSTAMVMLIVCYFTSQSTAMVMLSCQLTYPHFFLGKLNEAVDWYFVHMLSLVTDTNPS